MTNVRKEVMDVIRSCDILLYSGMPRGTLTEAEKGLLEAYVMRLTKELKLCPDVSASWDSSKPDRRQKVTA